MKATDGAEIAPRNYCVAPGFWATLRSRWTEQFFTPRDPKMAKLERKTEPRIFF